MQNIELYKEKVNVSLKKFLDKKLSEDSNYSTEIKKLIENVIEFNMRTGKRIRPLATIFAYRCFKKDDKIIDASIFIELMQAYLLIHDDIMDNSDTRRGKKSMHKLYSDEYGEELGKSIAILAGNLCSSYCYGSIIECDFSSNLKLNALRCISWINNRENYGQALDILPGFSEIKEEDIYKIYELKTATYTFQGPIYVGCILADAPEKKITMLQEYAYNLGIAFQIQDDLNSIFSNKEKSGKPNDSDILEGKKTLLMIKALEFTKGSEKDFLLKQYGNKNASPESVRKIKEIMKKCGAYSYCLKKFKDFVDLANSSIVYLDLKKEGKDYLLEMADYISGLVN